MRSGYSGQLLVQPGGGHDQVYQAEAPRLLRRNAIPQEVQLHGAAHPGSTDHAYRAAAIGRDAKR